MAFAEKLIALSLIHIYYFAVPKSRPDLMNDINAAMADVYKRQA